MRPRTKAWLGFGVFCFIFAALLGINQRYGALDHWMALIWLSFLVAAGVYALRANPGKARYGMPTFLGVFPKSWQRWFLGEQD
jgi:hypothetical protein